MDASCVTFKFIQLSIAWFVIPDREMANTTGIFQKLSQHENISFQSVRSMHAKVSGT